MYPVSNAFIEAVKANNRKYYWTGRITTTAGTVYEFDQDVWVAYEPVWSIGVNGTPAALEYAGLMHGKIRECLVEMFGEKGNGIPCLYGGSVNYENSSELIRQKDIDGLFIGRAAWDADNFDRIIRNIV